MPRFVAFLRAINVGGHTVAMGRLRQLFEESGFARVETFIASGNVIFETPSRGAAAIERQIEKMLREALGYEVATFLRTPRELAAIAAFEPLPASKMAQFVAVNVVFLPGPMDDGARKKLAALTTEVDEFRVEGREIYWFCRKKQSESTISNVALEKALARRSTIRGRNTVRKLSEKYRP